MPAFVDTYAGAGAKPWWWGMAGVTSAKLLDDDVDGFTMQREAGLMWTVEKRPVFYPRHGGFEEVPHMYTIVRGDSGASLGACVGRVYQTFQNSELFALGDALAKTGDARWHTAGSLRGGRKIWALAQINGSFEVRRRSGERQTEVPFLLLYNVHDGSSRLRVKLVRERVVCWNTLQCALGENGVEWACKHTGDLSEKVEDAIEVLGLAVDRFEEQNLLMQELAEQPFTRSNFVGFAAAILTGEDDEGKAMEVVAKSEGRSQTMYQRKGNELLRLFEHGKGNHGESRYDALSAVTEFIDHQRGRAARAKRNHEKALDSALFGDGERKKKKALQLLTRW